MEGEGGTVGKFKKPPVWKNIGPRLLSALLFAAICIPPIYFGGYIWAIFAAILGLRISFEWVRMSDPSANWIAYAVPMAGVLIAIGYAAQSLTSLWTIALLVTILFAGLERARRSSEIKPILFSALGALYIILPTVLMVALRGDDVGFTSGGFKILMFIILTVIGADVGAYLGGSAIKGPKIAPKISPNKTWSGFLSGLLLGSVIAVGCGFVFGISWSSVLWLAVPIVVFSVIGDFLESALKRHFNVKDTGTLLPGHGGLLDRLDGLMMAVVASAAVLASAPAIWSNFT
jgi:phosphatidate cytidylyltransferase